MGGLDTWVRRWRHPARLVIGTGFVLGFVFFFRALGWGWTPRASALLWGAFFLGAWALAATASSIDARRNRPHR